MTFDELNLNPPLLKALAELDYIYPTPIQKQAFPVIMSGRNVVGIAQTGTGKTFAYLLPIIRQLVSSKQKDPRVLIIAPTRELVVQLLNEVRKLTKYTQLRSEGIYGGTNINTQKQMVFDGVDILVSTPGRLTDLTLTGVLRLKSIQKLVIDEVDKMFGLGFRFELTQLLNLVPAKRQTLMFSATLTKDVHAFIAENILLPFYIEIAPHGTPIDKILQKAYHVPNYNTKLNLLELLMNEHIEFSKVLVFVGHKKIADQLYNHFDKIFPGQVGVIHSNRSHNVRFTALKQFEEGVTTILIATDVIARGMDISDVMHVINFDMPESSGDYIHRIGRTGRADKVGGAISFISPWELEYQLAIEKMMLKEIPQEALPENLIISKVYTEEEKPTNLFDKTYLKPPDLKDSQGAFHEKIAKNKKINLGSAYKRNPKFTKNGKRIKKNNKSGKTRY
ncbi:MAG: DEAD/DEAH box helicase [Bacteroidota bacterium]